MVTHVFSCIRRLNRVLDASIRTFNSTSKCTTMLWQTKIMKGSNGEKFFLSPDISYPETLVHEFVWNNVENYPDHVALVILII